VRTPPASTAGLPRTWRAGSRTRGWSSFPAATPRRRSAIRSRCSPRSRGSSPLFPEGEAGESSEAERVLATVLFTDIVGATAAAAEFGDQRWRQLLTAHHDRIRRELARYRGREVDTAGDRFFATFDGPARAV